MTYWLLLTFSSSLAFLSPVDDTNPDPAFDVFGQDFYYDYAQPEL